MISNTRKDCTYAVTLFSNLINSENKDILYVGIAGDPIGGEYSFLFKSKPITFDSDKKWNPDIIGDITKTNFNNSSYDIIIIVQVIEHISNIFDLPLELYRILKPSGFLIIDCPFNYPYHPEPPSFGDFWRITKDGFNVLFPSDKWRIIKSHITDHNTSFLFQKI